jgi:hypothetical protein
MPGLGSWPTAGRPDAQAEESVTLKAPMDAPQDGTKPKNTFPLLWPRLLDVDGAAHYLSVSPWQVRRLVAESHLRRVCLPGGNEEAQGCRRWLVDRFDLDELIDDAPKTTASMCVTGSSSLPRLREHSRGRHWHVRSAAA